ncbi:Cytosolic copper metallochaperone [Neurospora sp. IMI 360204]|nr:Cytosolic copper metallochaperone [Neurospora sp. IMI 360204]
MSDEYKYEFNVEMSCGGCSRAVNHVLKKLEENETKVISYTVSEPKDSTATVITDDDSELLYDKIYGTISKTGKKVNSCKLFKNGVYVRDMIE